MLKNIINFFKSLFSQAPSAEEIEQDKRSAAGRVPTRACKDISDEDLPVYARGRVLPPKAKAKYRAAAKKRK